MNLYKLKFSYLIIFLSIFLTTSLVAAPVYKWIDEDGQVHYGSKPKKENAEEINIKNRYIDSGNDAPPLSAEERANRQKQFLDAYDAEKKSLSEEKRKKKEQEEVKLSRCHAARDQLRRQESATALYDLDEKGNRILLNKKQYEIAMRQARARVERWCN